MAILKDLIVHGSSRFLNKIYANELETPLINADEARFTKLIAKDASLEDVTVTGLLDVQGQLHTNTWTNSSISTIEGSFYIMPTLSNMTDSDSNVLTFIASTENSYPIVSVQIGSNQAFAGMGSLQFETVAGVQNDTAGWTGGSKVLLTGEVKVGSEWLPLGTIVGTLYSFNSDYSSIEIKDLKDNKGRRPAPILLNFPLSSQIRYRNLKISLCERYISGNSKYYPIGIYMTALGSNGKTFLDIYGGGQEANVDNAGGLARPNVRIGNLNGLPSIGSQVPKGWGIYTTHGYFSGTVVADTGNIGGWNLTANSIWKGNQAFQNANGMYFGSSGISLGSTFSVSNTGVLTATNGQIGGWNLTANSIWKNNQNFGNANGMYFGASGISLGSTFKVTNTGVLTATSGLIGGWSLNSNSFSIGEIGEANSAMINSGIVLQEPKEIGGSEELNNWIFTTGANFGVTGDGTLYANNANITGTIYAKEGNIGGIEIIDGRLHGENFGIEENGDIYVNNANVTGIINAIGGNIGGIEIENGRLNLSSLSIGEFKDANEYAQKEDLQVAKRITTYYLVSSKSNNVTFEDEGWSIEIPTVEEDKKYIWAYEVRKGEEIHSKDKIVSFQNNGDQILFDNLIVDINPVQSGSGDPSPDNVRPISGWTGANAAVTGINIWDEEWESGGLSWATGENANISQRIRSKNYNQVQPNTTYYIKTPINVYPFYYDANKDLISYESNSKGNVSIITPSNARYIRFFTAADAYGETYNHDISINYPSTDTAYHEGHAKTVNVDWQSEAGTVYGGTIDVVSGELMVDRAMVDLGTLNWDVLSAQYANYFITGSLRNSIKGVTHTVSSSYSDGVPDSSYDSQQDKSVNVRGNAYVVIRDSSYTDAATFKTAMNGVQLVYELATPITYQLTSTEVKSLLGQNHVWADCGDTELTYSTNAVRGNPYLIGMEDVDSAINSIQDNVNHLSSTVNNYLGAWITLGTQKDDNGNDIPIMRLGSSSSSDPLSPNIQAVLTNEKLDFRVNDSSVAYIAVDTDDNNTGKLFATNSLVASEVQFGDWAWYQRENGHLSVKWKGGSNS